MFLDNFTSIAYIDNIESAENLIKELANISEKYEIDFVISLTADKDSLSDYLKEFVTVTL